MLSLSLPLAIYLMLWTDSHVPLLLFVEYSMAHSDSLLVPCVHVLLVPQLCLAAPYL